MWLIKFYSEKGIVYLGKQNIWSSDPKECITFSSRNAARDRMNLSFKKKTLLRRHITGKIKSEVIEYDS